MIGSSDGRSAERIAWTVPRLQMMMREVRQ